MVGALEAFSIDNFIFRRLAMGALIVTKGTRRLVHFFNGVFSSLTPFAAGNAYAAITTDLGPNSTIAPSPAYPFLYQLSEKYKGQRLDGKGGDVFYPDYSADHKNLLPRWKFFLRKELDPTWHNEIGAALYEAITAGGYNKVVFDCVIGTVQEVMIADEYNFTTDGKEDNKAGTKYMKIVLVTPETKAPDPRDDQTPR
jgi:hypothetical protein